MAARRARQIQGGARPLVDTNSRKPCKVAREEIVAGKVPWIIPEKPKTAVDEAHEFFEKPVPGE